MLATGRKQTTGCLGGIDIAGSPIDTPGYQRGDVPDGGGCQFRFTAGISYERPDGGYETQGNATVTGGTCSTNLVPETTPVPTGTTKEPEAVKDPCPNGFVGTVNGLSVCARHDTNSGVDWSGTKVTTDGSGNQVQEVTDTSCSGGQCTTTVTTTTTTSSGTSTTSAVTTRDTAQGTCKTNGANGVCSAMGLSSSGNGTGGDSSFTGTCAQGFKAVSDDAVINAMAEEQYRRNCEVLGKDSPEAKVVGAASDKDGKTKADNPNDAEVKIGPSDIDQSDALGGGGCSLDKTITVAKMQVTLPFNVICNPLAALGHLLVAVSLLGAMVIVTRG